MANIDSVLYPDKPDMELINRSRALPWSFTNNVIIPIDYLEAMDIDPVRELERTDGWILNTLFAKLMHSTQITKGVRHAKKYDVVGKLVSEEAPAPEPLDEDVWVGSIHPIFAMIKLADSEKGESANVSVEQGKGVQCFASPSAESAKKVSEEDVSMGAGPSGSGMDQDTIWIRTEDEILRPSMSKNSRVWPSGNEEVELTKG
ncbi:hypothetical protein MMC26_005959 [Xylographa opegraphella]|nr:hypothetical protein [Xylographa opegraphella]